LIKKVLKQSVTHILHTIEGMPDGAMVEGLDDGIMVEGLDDGTMVEEDPFRRRRRKRTY